MKKILIILLVLWAQGAFATTALYRISSNEVYKISEENDIFAFDVSDQLAVATSVSTPDGDATWDTSGNLRVLGYSKILDGTTVRNATQEEIDTFAAFEAEDRNIKEADQATAYFQNDPRIRRIMIAFADILVSEINILRAEHGLSDRTLQQLKTAIINRISKDD